MVRLVAAKLAQPFRIASKSCLLGLNIYASLVETADDNTKEGCMQFTLGNN
jgi:hypothetical protein